jgi:hypothetical protein
VNGIAVILNDGERLPLYMRRTPFPHTRTTRRQKETLLGRRLAPWERNPPPRVHQMPQRFQTSRQSEGPVPICFHCGVPGHVVKDCRLRHVVVTCRLCGQTGHKQRYCVTGQKRPTTVPTQTKAPLLPRPMNVNDSIPRNQPVHVQAPQSAQPNLCNGAPSTAQDVNFVRYVAQPMYAPGFHPGTYGLSYYQNFPPLPNSTPQNF